MHTTLNEIRKHSPCHEGWKKLLATLGKTKADDESLHLRTILDCLDEGADPYPAKTAAIQA